MWTSRPRPLRFFGGSASDVGADPSFWYGLQTARGDGALVQPILAWGQTYRAEYGIFHEGFDWNNMRDSRSP